LRLSATGCGEEGRRLVSAALPRSSPRRKPGSFASWVERVERLAQWVPAFAGMTKRVWRRYAPTCVVALPLLLLVTIVAAAAPTFPSLTGRIVDDAGVIPAATRTELDAKLAELEAKTTDQLVVVTLKSLGGYDISDYGYQLGRAWGIGQKGKNNGVLLIVAPNERDVRIEVGYGREGDLTDAVTRLIIENSILPRFRAGDMAGGISAGVDDIIKVLSGDAATYKQRAAQEPKDFAARRPDSQNGGGFAFILFIFVLFIIFSRVGRFWWPWLFLGGGGWGRGGGWPSGGGGWSSGGGGFSGGGGSFGGGGASGRW
jgi:uncharacterized protein